jgi:hypothetical protein
MAWMWVRCFWKSLKRGSFPIFGVSGGAELALGRGKRRLPEKRLHFEGPRPWGGDIRSPIQEPKWKYWFKTIGFTLTDVELAGARFTSAVDPGWTKVLVDE